MASNTRACRAHCAKMPRNVGPVEQGILSHRIQQQSVCGKPLGASTGQQALNFQHHVWTSALRYPAVPQRLESQCRGVTGHGRHNTRANRSVDLEALGMRAAAGGVLQAGTSCISRRKSSSLYRSHGNQVRFFGVDSTSRIFATTRCSGHVSRET